jgi:putative membrane protein
VENNNRSEDDKGFGIGRMIIRVVVSAIVLAVTAFLTPGFAIDGLWPLLVAAVVIGVVDHLIERFTGFDASPFGRGITGFIVSAAIIYLTGFFIRGVRVSILGALIAALVIGIIDMLIPGGKKVM